MQIRPDPAHALGGRDLPGKPGAERARERSGASDLRRRRPGSRGVGLQWRAWCRSWVRWGCFLCLRCPRCSETAPAPTAGHTQVPARAAGGRLGLPTGPQAPAVLTASALLLRGRRPGRPWGYGNPAAAAAAAAAQEPARAGLGRGAALGGAVHRSRRGFCAVQVLTGAGRPGVGMPRA